MSALLNNLGSFLWSQSWHISILFIFLALVCLALRRASAHWRYLLCLVLLLKCLLPALVPISVPVISKTADAVLTPLTRSVQAVTSGTQASTQTVSSKSSQIANASVGLSSQPGTVTRNSIQIRSWLMLGWAIGAIGFLGFALVRALRVQKRLKQSRTWPNMELECEFLDLLKTVGVRSRPNLCLIEGISQPFVWGIFRGCIYLPANFQEQGSAQQRRLVMMHELMHVLRWDALVNFIQVIIQAVFWFHPLVWWLNRMIRHEREKCCDEMAIAGLKVSSQEYGAAIVDRLVSHFEAARPASSLAISGQAKDLEDRLTTILAPGRMFHWSPTRAVVASVLLLTICVMPIRLVVNDAKAFNQTHGDAGRQLQALDLSAYYNAGLNQSWLPSTSDNDFSGLVAGPQALGGVPFDVRGLIQLAGADTASKFPGGVNGIKVGTAFTRLHFLHASAGREGDGAPVASLILNYADGRHEKVQINYGERVRDWWFWGFESVRDPNTAMAWTGNNPGVRARGGSLRVYRTTWINPRPGIIVTGIDYVSARSQSAPFMLAMTVE